MDLKNIKLKPIKERKNKTSIKEFVNPEDKIELIKNKDLEELANSIISARKKDKEVILMMGAHPIKLGLSPYIIDLIKKGFITHIAMNGATSIHDFEIALIGATSEYVEENIKDGSFGMWRETSLINDIIKNTEKGYGETLGNAIVNGNFKYKDLSILATAYRSKIPATVHVAIGTDIIHVHKNFDGASTGKASQKDLLTFIESVSKLEDGVVANIGSAVIMPEVFLKSLSAARNLGYKVEDVTRANLDMVKRYRSTSNVLERPFKKGEYFNIIERHEKTIPTLYYLLTK
jgi:deoxyhypusine synthase